MGNGRSGHTYKSNNLRGAKKAVAQAKQSASQAVSTVGSKITNLASLGARTIQSIREFSQLQTQHGQNGSEADGFTATWRAFIFNSWLISGNERELTSEGLNVDWANKLRDKLDRNSVPLQENLNLIRNIKPDQINRLTGLDGNALARAVQQGNLGKDELNAISNHLRGIKKQSNKAFSSTSWDPNRNVFIDRPFQLNVVAMKGTPAIFPNNTSESEIILSRNTHWDFTGGVRVIKNNWGQRVLQIDVVVEK